MLYSKFVKPLKPLLRELLIGHAIVERHLRHLQYNEFFRKSPKHSAQLMLFAKLRIYYIAFDPFGTQEKTRDQKMILSGRFFQNNFIKVLPKFEGFWSEKQGAGFVWKISLF